MGNSKSKTKANLQLYKNAIENPQSLNKSSTENVAKSISTSSQSNLNINKSRDWVKSNNPTRLKLSIPLLKVIGENLNELNKIKIIVETNRKLERNVVENIGIDKFKCIDKEPSLIFYYGFIEISKIYKIAETNYVTLIRIPAIAHAC